MDGMRDNFPTPGAIGPDGRCVTCGKRVETTGGCSDCRMGSYITVPATEFSLPATTVTPPTVWPTRDPDATMCPHARPDWRMCPHCLGIAWKAP
jgi:hypothetical protein